MAVTIDTDKNITLKQDDPIAFDTITIGRLKAEVDDTCVFMIKTNVADADNEAIINQAITVTEENIITVEISTSTTSALDEGTYYWSLKLTKGSNKYTIVPDDGDDTFPTFVIGEVLIDA